MSLQKISMNKSIDILPIKLVNYLVVNDDLNQSFTKTVF
jgi:hypothetical protein